MANFSAVYLTCRLWTGITFYMAFSETGLLETYLADVSNCFRGYKKLAERALEQVDDEEIMGSRGGGSNSIALIVKHIAGNQRSRWRDFLTEDGEKPDRNRDFEFEYGGESREDLMKAWEDGWRTMFGSIDSLAPEDLSKTVLIRGERHSVFQAISRQLTHYAYHIGQIVLLAKEIRGDEWKTLSVPKGRSNDFNAYMAERIEGGAVNTNPLEGTELFSVLETETGAKDE